MLIIGSTAFQKYFPSRNPKDLDLILNPGEEIPQELVDLGKKIEPIVAEPGSCWEMYLKVNPGSEILGNVVYASLETLFSMKLAHVYIPYLWQKHILDFDKLNEKFNGVDAFPEITKANRVRANQVFKHLTTPALKKVSTENFFGQSDQYVKPKYVHDELHKIMAHIPHHPMYEKMQYQDGTVECHKELWDKMTPQEQDQCVLEEAYVIALERIIIPAREAKKVFNPFAAFQWAIMRICTTLCSGWFRKHAVMNHARIMKQYDNGFFDKFAKAEPFLIPIPR